MSRNGREPGIIKLTPYMTDSINAEIVTRNVAPHRNLVTGGVERICSIEILRGKEVKKVGNLVVLVTPSQPSSVSGPDSIT